MLGPGLRFIQSDEIDARAFKIVMETPVMVHAQYGFLGLAVYLRMASLRSVVAFVHAQGFPMRYLFLNRWSATAISRSTLQYP